jgi:sortase (surface protein transpeptidase)
MDKNFRKKINILIGISLIIISLFIFSYTFVLNNKVIGEAENFIEEDIESIENTPSISPTQVLGDIDKLVNSPTLPPKDNSLPIENRIVISKIGVDSIITEGEDSEEALKNGVWRANDFNTPSGNAIRTESPPTILASHVYGYDNWSEDFRQKVSFRGLSNLSPGDIIEINWDQRKYIYEIKFGEVNTEISNYADYGLILYTCEDLSGSANRVIRYAELIDDINN